MSIKEYLKDSVFPILIEVLAGAFIVVFMLAFQVPKSLIHCTIFIYLLQMLTVFLYQYLRRRRYYNIMLQYCQQLDEKNLLAETLEEPDFYEGKIVNAILRQMGSSMTEQISKERYVIKDFKEYLEMWVHEMKLPLASMTLQLHNSGKVEESALRRADNIVEEILYYTRSETTEKDFLIKEVPVRKLISEVASKYRVDLQAVNMELEVQVADETVMTDSKWIVFCMGQIINNAIKYRDLDKESHRIRIHVETKDAMILLHIWDNGIGIQASDVNRITEKSFTGRNGHAIQKSTGMGLYIVANLCRKLGHKLVIDSKEGEYTEVTILFSENNH